MGQPGWITKPSPKLTTAAVVLLILHISVVFATRPMQAQTLHTLHAFRGPDGGYPWASLIGDSVGNLYGTTYYGGASNFGTVFKLDKTRTLTVLHSFTGGTEGKNPEAGLIRDAAGNLYGTTLFGGEGCNSDGCGTVFKVDKDGTETVLYAFASGTSGAGPMGSLVRDKSGNLYGTTSTGTILSWIRPAS